MISCLLLILGFFCCSSSSFSSCFRCKVRLSIRCFSCFLRQDCVAINFPLRTAFAASHRFWVVVFSLSFVPRIFYFIFLLASSVTYWLFRNMLVNFHVFVFLIAFSCNIYLVSYHCGQRRYWIQFQFS